MNLSLSKKDTAGIEQIISRELLDAGAQQVIVVDLGGNMVLESGSLETDDIRALAVLAAANFATTVQIARLLGEDDFTLMFHKGDKRNIHFNRLDTEHLIVTFFDDGISLGLIRLKSHSVVEQVMNILGGVEDGDLQLSHT